ncbi:MAG: type II toxin-antitoxin system RelE/ParE family toxin [Gammaproteobacteria bacterium]
MAHVIYAERALLDLERLTEFLRESEPLAAEETSGLIVQAIDVLRNHPLIGRPAEAGLRELVISRGESGYLALYRFRESSDAVVVLAIRHQRESGYAAAE